MSRWIDNYVNYFFHLTQFNPEQMTLLSSDRTLVDEELTLNDLINLRIQPVIQDVLQTKVNYIE